MNLANFSSDYAPLIQTGAMVVGLYSIFLLKKQISENTHWNRVNSAYKLIFSSCLHDREIKMKEALKKIKISLNHDHEVSGQDVLSIFNDDSAYKAAMDYLNYIERVCAGVAYKAVDEKLVYAFYSDVFNLTYKQFKSFISKYRHDFDDEEFFIELEKLATKWIKHTEERKKENKYLVQLIKERFGIGPKK